MSTTTRDQEGNEWSIVLVGRSGVEITCNDWWVLRIDEDGLQLAGDVPEDAVPFAVEEDENGTAIIKLQDGYF